MVEAVIERIRAARELVSIYDLLREQGIEVILDRPQKIHCPVHEDQHKSAVVYPDSQEIYCFAEAKTYDVVSLVQAWESMEWWEACAWLEERVGVVYERQSNPQDQFWSLLRSRDEKKMTGRQFYELRWQIHRSVLELAEEEVDWSIFDDLTNTLDLGKLRAWQRKWIYDDIRAVGDAARGGSEMAGDPGMGVAAGH